MTNKEAAMVRWLAQIYAARGHIGKDHWAQFEQFIADHNLWVEPTPGRRVDGANPWDVFEIKLRAREATDFDAQPQRVQLGQAVAPVAIHRGDSPAVFGN